MGSNRPSLGVCVVLASALIATAAHATSWNVPGDASNTCTIVNPSCDTIQGAVTASSDGDDIQVAAGTYPETNITVDKTLVINGAGSGSTTVTPAGVGFIVTTNDVTISNLGIQGGTDAIRVQGAGIAGPTFDGIAVSGVSSDGIEISSTGTTNVLVTGSTFTGGSNGIRMTSGSEIDGLTVQSSTFSAISSVGIYQANDAGTSTLQNLLVDDSDFLDVGFTGIYAEEIADSTIQNSTFVNNGRGILIFKGYATSGADVGNLTISGNEFTDSVNASLQLVIQATGLAAPIDVTGNTFAQDVGALALNWGVIDVRLASALTHAATNVTGNSITLSGTFGAATAAHGIVVRGNGPVVVTGNDLDGGHVGGPGTTPPTSGIWIRSVDAIAAFAQIPATATFSASCNRIDGFANGVSVYDSVGLDYGGLLVGTTVTLADNSIVGNDSAGIVNGAAPPTIDAENNWFGCTAGPGNPGCDTVVGDVDADPAATAPPACVACIEDSDCDDDVVCSIPDTCQAGVCVSGGSGDANMNGICDEDDFIGIPIAATKLIVVDKVAAAGKAKAVYVAKDAGVTKGAGTDVATISARLDFRYDSTSGAFVVPAGASNGTDGWKVNKSTVAKYVNKLAPSGPTEAKVTLVKPGKLGKVVGKGLGDEPVDLIGGGAPSASVYTAFAVTNDGDTFTHCSEFAAGSCSFKEIAGGTGRKLACKRGTGDVSCLAITGP